MAQRDFHEEKDSISAFFSRIFRENQHGFVRFSPDFSHKTPRSPEVFTRLFPENTTIA